MLVRAMAAADVTWAARVMDQRRQLYARYSPVFWRPARDAISLHTRFLASQMAAPRTIALRSDGGLLIAELRGPEVLIDDFAVTGEGRWPADGARLLAAAWEQAAAAGARTARVVTAAADGPKVALLVSAGLVPASRWWVKPVTPTGPPARAGRVQGTGFAGRLGPAPPVYAPGGPVLLADDLPGRASLAAVEAGAAAAGAVLVIVPAAPGAADEQQLAQRGWTVASQWHLGTPAPPTPPPGTRQPSDTA
jgi:hypothetical protein